ncbi:MAG: UbiA family prenyltransferase [Hyphomicrobiales bacterium]|nr:UbiA family prenyltransferase [Hyphomicrobiales bacterium]
MTADASGTSALAVPCQDRRTGPRERREQEGCAISQVEQVVSRKGVLSSLVEAMRLHQWAKNLLVFVPLFLAGKVENLLAWTDCLIGFLAIGMLASSTYLLNDVLDLQSDRRHWSKRERALARGDLPVAVALVAGGIGILLSFALAAAIGSSAAFVLVIYAASTAGYSLGLKRVPVLDVFLLAFLFTLRLIFGACLADVAASPWLLAFSMFLFTSLSLVKRQTEIRRSASLGRDAIDGRGYVAADLIFVFGLGVAAAAGAVLILVLYVMHEALGAGLYRAPVLLWSMPAIMFLWLGRIWLLAGRNTLDDDPLQFAVRDNVSLVLGASMVLAFVGAWQITWA